MHHSGALWSEWRVLAVLVFSIVAKNPQKKWQMWANTAALSSVFQPALKNTGLTGCCCPCCACWIWLGLPGVWQPWVNMKYSAGFTWGTVEAWKCCTESMADTLADTYKFEKCVAFLVFLSGKPGSAEKYFCIAIATYKRRLYHKEGTCYKLHKLNNILICTVQNGITWGRREF